MEGLDGTIASTDQSSREPSLSPKITRATFREPPVSSVSGPSSTSKVGHASGYLDPVFADGSSASAPKKGKAKAGTKGKNKSGKRYTAVSYDDEQPNEEEEDEGEEDQLLKDRRGRMMGLGAAGGKTKGIKKAMKKSGLDEYEKALWQWVNVEDLDGFLEEVSCCRLPLASDILDGQHRFTHITKAKGYTALPWPESSISCQLSIPTCPGLS